MERIKLHDLSRVSSHIQKDLDRAYRECMEQAQYLRGPQVRKFEEAWMKYTGVEDCAAVTSGTDALHTAGMIADIGPGDEVILCAHTFVATGEAFVNLGAELRYVDAKTSDYCIDEQSIKHQITKKTKAIVWTDVNGQTPDVDAITKVASEHGITTIDDASMAHGATYNGRMAGTHADITAFSFGPVKPLGAIGGAGAITGSVEVCDRAREIRNHGRPTPIADQGAIPRSQRDSVGDRIGWNRNMHSLQAGFLLAKLPYLDELNDMKRNHAFRYNSLLSDVVEHVPEEQPGRHHVYHLYSLLSEHRDRLRVYLDQAGIESLVHWKIPINEYPFLTQTHVDKVPISKQISLQTLSLPCHPFLKEDEQDYIIEHVRRFYETTHGN
jgi:dTDP-4-amino-4,6-dideoxygalactose transaminase